MTDKKIYRKIFIFVSCILVLVGAIIVFGFLNTRYNIGFPCVVNKLFGVYCPGCGLTRAGVAMMKLDFYQAFRYNALSVILLPLLFITIVAFFWEGIFNKSSFVSKIPISFWIVLFLLTLIYGIIRNFIPFLQPLMV